MRPQPLVVIGGGGHGRVVFDAAKVSGRLVRGFIDDTRTASTLINGCPVLGGIELLEDDYFVRKHAFIVALGDQEARQRIGAQLLQRGGTLDTIIHPSSVVAETAIVGAGTVAVARTVVNANAYVGKFCILNTGCTIDHDVHLADGVQIGPGANLAGGVKCGEGAVIGTGAVIIPRITIGPRAMVGAGAVVIRDVNDGEVVVGNPARAKERRNTH